MKNMTALILSVCLLGVFFSLPAGGKEEWNCYVNDEDHHVYASGKAGDKAIALTFDDGPHPEYTAKILDVLDKYGVKATFFVIGENAELYPEPLLREVSAGHSIGSHTYSHRHIRCMNEVELEKEFLTTSRILQKFGVAPMLFRPPEGVCDRKVIRIAEKHGCDIILWTVDTEDWRSPPCKSIVNNVLSHVKGGEIILMHDYVAGKSHTAEALEILIPRLLADGYEFVTVENLIGRKTSL